MNEEEFNELGKVCGNVSECSKEELDYTIDEHKKELDCQLEEIKSEEKRIENRIRIFKEKNKKNVYSDIDYEEDKKLIDVTIRDVQNFSYLYEVENEAIKNQFSDRIFNLKLLINDLQYQTFYFESLLNQYQVVVLKNQTSEIYDSLNEQKAEYKNLGYTVLNMIITFTIISTAITAIDKINTVYIPLFCFTIVWMGISITAFNYSIFSKDKSSPLSRKIYVTITFLTVIVLIATISFGISNCAPFSSENNNNNNCNKITCYTEKD